MLAYLILVGRNGAPVDAGLVDRFSTDPPELPLVPERRIIWKNRTGSVVFFGWEAFTGFGRIGSHWHVDDAGLTAFSNHCWPMGTGWDDPAGRSWAAQLYDVLRDRNDAFEVRARLCGQFHLIDLPATGRGWVIPDYMNSEPLFFAEGAEIDAISNRAGLCAAAVTARGATPERSLLGAGWLLCHGSMLEEETGYWDVRHLPFGHSIAVESERGASVVDPGRSPLIPEIESSYEETLDRVDQELRAIIRAIAGLPIADLELALSGGKDSRLLTAVILNEGLKDRFRFVTNGPPDKSDPIVARQIADTFGLDWSLVDRTGRSADAALEDALVHTGLVEGVTSAWDSVGSTVFASGATVSGFAGEYLRWGGLAIEGARVQSPEELVALVKRRVALDPLKILRPEALAYYEQSLENWVVDHLERGDALDQVASLHMQETRARTRAGPTQTWNARLRISPYLTRGIVQAAHGLPRAERPDYRLQIDLMRRYSVALSKVPFADAPWGEERIAHLPDADSYRQIEPVLSRSAARNWRLMNYETYRPMLETYLLDQSNPIHELIQYDRLADRIATGDRHPGRTRMLWGALTAAIWMGHHELQARISPPG